MRPAAVVLVVGVVIGQRPASADAATSSDDPWRIAILVANNGGNQTRVPLRYAEQDAADLAAVLTELGGFKPEDTYLLRGRALPDVRAAIAGVKARLAEARTSGRRVMTLLYFSGHSDGEALELGDDRWSFADVRQTLRDLGADVRIVIVDSCRSGALIGEKGRPGPTFDIRFSDDLATSGEAILTSSAAHEAALESRQIRASFFSHHLISGLRGAADSSGDGRVTLGEAYRYAFVNTLLATSNTLSGPQHPEYDFRLTGRGELVLTDVLAPGAKLLLPSAFDAIVIADADRHHLVAELGNESARRIALPAGRYVIQGRREGRTLQIAVALREGESREIAAAELSPTRGAQVVAKGDDLVEIEAPARVARREGDAAVGVGVGLGITRGAADAVPWVGALRLEGAFGRRRGWLLHLDLASGRATGFRESAGYLAGGYFLGLARGRVAARAGWQVMAGPIVQALDTGPRYWTTAVGTGPWIDGAVALGHGVSVGLSLGASGVALRRDQAMQIALWPSAAAAVRLEL
jgi:hypothetical protein